MLWHYDKESQDDGLETLKCVFIPHKFVFWPVYLVSLKME